MKYNNFKKEVNKVKYYEYTKQQTIDNVYYLFIYNIDKRNTK